MFALHNSVLISALALLLPAWNITAKEEKWIQLFNGQDLSNWTVKIRGYEVGNNHNNTFSVKNGVIRVSYDQYDDFNETFGHLFYNLPFPITFSVPNIVF